MAEPIAPEQPGAALILRPWAPAVLAVVVAVGLAVPTLPHAWTTPPVWAVLVLFVAFLLSESVQLDLEFRRQTFSVTPSELVVPANRPIPLPTVSQSKVVSPSLLVIDFTRPRTSRS